MLIVEGVGKAFPSGHSAIAGVFTVLAIYFMYKHINLKNSISIFILYIFVFISFLLVPISRLYLHVHDMYDVVAGYSIGVLVTIFCVNYSHKFFRRKDY
jgi:membrane-associated phospholipid phosphatase